MSLPIDKCCVVRCEEEPYQMETVEADCGSMKIDIHVWFCSTHIKQLAKDYPIASEIDIEAFLKD